MTVQMSGLRLMDVCQLVASNIWIYLHEHTLSVHVINISFIMVVPEHPLSAPLKMVCLLAWGLIL